MRLMFHARRVLGRLLSVRSNRRQIHRRGPRHMSKRQQSAEDRREAKRIAKWSGVVGRAERELATLRVMVDDGMVNARSWSVVHRQLTRVLKAVSPLSRALAVMAEQNDESRQWARSSAIIAGLPVEEEHGQ
jgi:type II secretory pathway component PulF